MFQKTYNYLKDLKELNYLRKETDNFAYGRAFGFKFTISYSDSVAGSVCYFEAETPGSKVTTCSFKGVEDWVSEMRQRTWEEKQNHRLDVLNQLYPIKERLKAEPHDGQYLYFIQVSEDGVEWSEYCEPLSHIKDSPVESNWDAQKVLDWAKENVKPNHKYTRVILEI